MIVKNEDAKDKWCPHSRVVFVQSSGNVIAAAGNRRFIVEKKTNGAVVQSEDEGPMRGSFCLGPSCMMWLPLSSAVGRCGFLNASRGDWDGMTND